MEYQHSLTDSETTDSEEDIAETTTQWLVDNCDTLERIIMAINVQRASTPWYLAGPMEGERRHAEMMSSAPQRIYNNLRMNRHVFVLLCKILEEEKLLKPSQYVSVGQQVHIYIRAMGHRDSLRSMTNHFQHSLETISRYITAVMDGLAALYERFVRLPKPDYIAPRIENDSKYMPFFENCIGALDGTHFAATVTGISNPASWRNRKGFVSQNVLIVCSFDMTYLYVLPGWEGSAHDGLVLSSAREKGSFNIPPGKFYLADAGYSLSDSILIPYRGVRYHLKESYTSALRPENKKELFNLRHASLRNVVERIIGVLKKRFPVLTYNSYYPFPKQARNVYALIMLSNFIQTYDRSDDLLHESVLDTSGNDFASQEETQLASETLSSTQARTAGEALREKIADAMWIQYESTILSRRQQSQRAEC